MARSGVVGFVVRNHPLIAIGIGRYGRVHRGKVETSGGRGASEMIALVPATDAAVPQYPADRIDKSKRAPFKLRGGAEARQPVNVGLVLRDIERRHVLHDGVGAGKAERDVLVFRDAAGVEDHIAGELRIGAFEKSGYTDREWIHRPKLHRGVVVGDQLQRFRQREIAIGAAE